MMSFTKPEEHNVSRCRQRKTEPQPQIGLTCIKIWRNLDVWFLIYASGQTNKQTDRHTDTQITVIRTPIGGEVIITDKNVLGVNYTTYTTVIMHISQ